MSFLGNSNHRLPLRFYSPPLIESVGLTVNKTAAAAATCSGTTQLNIFFFLSQDDPDSK
jgi:hypothetical protein